MKRVFPLVGVGGSGGPVAVVGLGTAFSKVLSGGIQKLGLPDDCILSPISATTIISYWGQGRRTEHNIPMKSKRKD